MIPFNDFKAQYKQLRQPIDQAVRRVMESGWFVLGTEVRKFEKEFATYLQSHFCVGVASGTEALTLSLLAQGIGPGDEVITTNVTAFPTITGIVQSGAQPVVVDILPENGLMDPERIIPKITKKTKAIIPVHLYGQACDMQAIMDIAEEFGLVVIEDCAQAVGAKQKGRFCGTFGISGAFSFYPTKNLGAHGDAGAIVTQNKATYEKLLLLRNYGQSNRYYHDQMGLNSRLDELQAAILRAKLPFLNQWNRKRSENALFYRLYLEGVTFLKPAIGNEDVYHLFVVKDKNRQARIDFLKQEGIAALIHYPIPINRQKAFPYQQNEHFPESERFCNQIMSLPIYPELTDLQLHKIANTFNAFHAKKSSNIYSYSGL
jgi:dTDP-4-amino-4,6-dideoxygalactose transaminase